MLIIHEYCDLRVCLVRRKIFFGKCFLIFSCLVGLNVLENIFLINSFSSNWMKMISLLREGKTFSKTPSQPSQSSPTQPTPSTKKVFFFFKFQFFRFVVPPARNFFFTFFLLFKFLFFSFCCLPSPSPAPSPLSPPRKKI